jgi:hypothetical protein
MPQFTRSSLKRLDKLMNQNGHSFKDTVVSPLKLRPSQKEISISIAEKIKVGRMQPLVISSDKSILDGHHRWLAMVMAMKDGRLPKTYKARVHMYTSPGNETLRLAKTLKTPKHYMAKK